VLTRDCLRKKERCVELLTCERQTWSFKNREGLLISCENNPGYYSV
jgi:hypothetical protein